MSDREITVRYFAAVREMLGLEEETVELGALAGEEDEPNVGDLWAYLGERHPDLHGLERHVRVAVNHDFADRERVLKSGDEAALIPPVSGGAGASREDHDDGERLTSDAGRFLVTDYPIGTDEIREIVARPEAGAIVTFEGVVRDHTGDHEVEYLEYECYGEMALEKLEEVAEEAHRKWETVQAAIHHRYGHLEVGETAVAIAVSSPHRDAAFEACRFVIDRLKEVVPIWKKEVGPEGDSWVGWGP